MSDRSQSRGLGVVSRAGLVGPWSRRWVGIEDLEERRLLATFTVNSNADFPVTAPVLVPLPGMEVTLRQAIVNANARAGADTIVFDLPQGATTIHPVTALPTVTGPTTIDGTSQPGYAGTPIVNIDGTGTIAPDVLTGNTDGLRFTGGSSTLRGVIIGGFDVSLAGAGVSIIGGSGNVIAGNWIGTDVTGSSPNANFEGVVVEGSDNNRIGGTTAADRNVIGGNGLDGVRFAGGGGSGNVVAGNYIGVNAAGDAPLGNGLSGVNVQAGPATNLLIGGTSAGARNVIGGNGLNGVTVSGDSGVRVVGNFIGTNAAGTGAAPNGASGVLVTGDSSDVTVGGTSAGARNVVSGNGGDGVLIDATGAGNVVQGNYVGTNATGTAAIPNLGNGVTAATAGVLIGGGAAGAGNLISGNDGNGVQLSGDGNRVEFNRIGTTADASAAIPNGDGVRVDGADNVIGTPASGNTIAYNRNLGVVVDPDPAFVRNAIRGNNIYLNGGLGIDLGDDGVTMNDPQDPDVGPNEFQNFPVLTSVTLSGGTATIQGTLNSTPNSTFAVDLFASQIWDTSTYGEGQKYLGSTTVTTDAAGNGSFSATLPGVPAGWNYFAATATDAVGNTSEFSYDPTPGAAPAADPAKPDKNRAHGPFGHRKLAALFDRAAAGDWIEKLEGLLARL